MQLVGKDSLSEDQKLTLEIANIIKNEFLQQNGFSDHDFTCPLEKVDLLLYRPLEWWRQLSDITILPKMQLLKLLKEQIESTTPF